MPLSRHLGLWPHHKIVSYYRTDLRRGTPGAEGLTPPSIHSHILLWTQFSQTPWIENPLGSEKCAPGVRLAISFIQEESSSCAQWSLCNTNPSNLVGEGSTCSIGFTSGLLIQNRLVLQTNLTYEVCTSDLSANLCYNQKCWALKIFENDSFLHTCKNLYSLMSTSHGPLNLSAEALDSAKHVSMSLKISVHLSILLKREISG